MSNSGVASAEGPKLSANLEAFLRAVDVLTCADMFWTLVSLAALFCFVNTTVLWLVKCCCISKEKRWRFSKTNCCLKGGLVVWGFIIWLASVLLVLLLTLEGWSFTPWYKFMKLKQPPTKDLRAISALWEAPDRAGNYAAEHASQHAQDQWNQHVDHDNNFLQFCGRMFSAFQGAIVAAAKRANDDAFWIGAIGHKVSSEEWLRAVVFYLGLLGSLQVAWVLEVIFIVCLIIWGDKESKKDKKKREEEEEAKRIKGKDVEKGEEQEALMHKGGGNIQYA